MKIWMIALLLSVTTAFAQQAPERMPKDFVYLRRVAPTILQDIRYVTHHNFIGRPIKGYFANECILTKRAALALAHVQHEFNTISFIIKSI